MTEHSHLDQRRRDPGECEACDEAWERQREHLKRIGPTPARKPAAVEIDRLYIQRPPK